MIPPIAINLDSVILQGSSPEERRDANARYVDNYNEWKK